MNAPLLVARGLTKTFGPKTILDSVELSVHPQERIGLVGINGSGKSTLARLLSQTMSADEGEIVVQRGVRVRVLTQVPSLDPDAIAREIVLEGLGEWRELRARFDALSATLAEHPERIEEADALSQEIERRGGWTRESEVDAAIGMMGVTRPEARVGTLSGGELRRVALAKLIVEAPELAILDEPTNHLDVHTIERLERFFRERFTGGLIVVTHDRAFLDNVVTRTIELERGKLYSFEGGWSDYVAQSAERAALSERTAANRRNFLRTEMEWLRRSPKARTSKSRARIKRAEEAQANAPPPPHGSSEFRFQTKRLGKTIVELHQVQLSLGGKTLVEGLTHHLVAGQRLGLVGPNGAGKTTLIRAIMGELAPTQGQITIGQHTVFAYLDQSRASLNDEATLIDNVSSDGKHVTIVDQTVDARAYLGRFQFSPERMREPVKVFSGGERARVALAKLLLQPANVIVLDEPTNDLDVQTLGALEEMLLEAEATALIVSHDRMFLDRVCTHTLTFRGEGKVDIDAGSYSEVAPLVAERVRQESREEKRRQEDHAPSPAAKAPAAEAGKKLSYREQRELDAIEAEIEALESALDALSAKLSDPALYEDGARAESTLREHAQAQRALEDKMARWEALEEKRA